MSEQGRDSADHTIYSGHAPLTDRANNEPAIMRGLTASETQIAALIFFPVWVVIGVLVAFITKIWAIGVLIASLAPMVTVWVLAGWLATIKRDRPDNFYLHKYWHWMAKSGFSKGHFINHNGHWDIGLEFDAQRTSKKNKP